MIVVHHLEQSRSQRIVWLLEELEVPYELKRYTRDKQSHLAPAALRAVHPLGKSPIVVDDGTVLIESGAIIEHLCARYGAGKGLVPPAGTPDHVAYLTFLHFAEGSMMPPLVMRLVFSAMAAKAPALVRPLVRAVTAPVERIYLRPNLTGILDYLEAELAERSWFAVSFTAADIQMGFAVESAQKLGLLVDARPRLRDYLGRIQSRPAYRRAMSHIGET